MVFTLNQNLRTCFITFQKQLHDITNKTQFLENHRYLLVREKAPAGTCDLIMPAWFPHVAENVQIFCSGRGHHGTAWGEQDALDACVLHIHCSRRGHYNVMVCADRKDRCAKWMCPQELEYLRDVEAPMHMPADAADDNADDAASGATDADDGAVNV